MARQTWAWGVVLVSCAWLGCTPAAVVKEPLRYPSERELQNGGSGEEVRALNNKYAVHMGKRQVEIGESSWPRHRGPLWFDTRLHQDVDGYLNADPQVAEELGGQRMTTLLWPVAVQGLCLVTPVACVLGFVPGMCTCTSWNVLNSLTLYRAERVQDRAAITFNRNLRRRIEAGARQQPAGSATPPGGPGSPAF